MIRAVKHMILGALCIISQPLFCENPPIPTPIEYRPNVHDAVFSPPKQRQVAVSCSDSLIRVWTLGRHDDDQELGGQLRAVLPGHAGLPSLGWAHNGNLISIGEDANLKIWEPWKYWKPWEWVPKIVFLPNVMVGARVRFLGFSEGHQHFAVRVIERSDVVLTPVGNVATGPHKVHVFTMNGDRLTPETGLETFAIHASFSPDGNELVTTSAYQSDSHLIRVWNIAQGKESRRFGRPTDVVPTECSSEAHFSPRGNLVSFDMPERIVRVRNFSSGKLLREIQPTSGLHTTRFAVSPEGEFVALGTAQGVTEFRDLNSGTLLRTLGEKITGEHPVVTSLSFNNSSTRNRITRLAVYTDRIRIYEVFSGKLLSEIKTPADRHETSTEVVLSPDGKYVMLFDRMHPDILVWPIP